MAGKVSFWYGTHREWAGVLETGITELPEILWRQNMNDGKLQFQREGMTAGIVALFLCWVCGKATKNEDVIDLNSINNTDY